MLWLLVIAVLLLVVTIAIVVAGWITYVPLVARGTERMPWLVAESQPAIDLGEACEMQTRDGLTLRGTYIPTSAARRMGVVIGLHELTGNRWSMWPYASDLHRRGFDVMLFDFRNHGQSDATSGYEPLPWVTRYELFDVEAVLEYVTSREDADPRGVGMIGVSRGGAIALCAAARDRRVRAIVTDGAFTTYDMQVHYVRRYMSIVTLHSRYLLKLPNWLLGTLGTISQWVVGRRQGVRFVPVESLAKRVRQPVLMIHGNDDPFVPVAVGESLRECLSCRSKSWIVPEARHNASLTTAPVEYRRRLARFFLKHLASGRRRQARRARSMGVST